MIVVHQNNALLQRKCVKNLLLKFRNANIPLKHLNPVNPDRHSHKPFMRHSPPFKHENVPPAMQPASKVKEIYFECKLQFLIIILHEEQVGPANPLIHIQLPFDRQIPSFKQLHRPSLLQPLTKNDENLNK